MSSLHHGSQNQIPVQFIHCACSYLLTVLNIQVVWIRYIYVYLWMCWPKLDLHNIIHVTKSLVCIISFMWYISTCVCVLYKWISILSCEYYNDVQYTVYILKSFVSMSFNVINKVHVYVFVTIFRYLLFLLNHSFEYRYFFSNSDVFLIV